MLKRRWVMLAGIVPALFAGAVMSACGGDDSGGSSSGGPGNVQTGSDEAFVTDICKAFTTFADSLGQATKDMGSGSSADLSKLMATMAKPYEQLAKDFAKAKPPSDLKDWHSQASKALTDMADKLKNSKDPSALSELGNAPVPDMPKSADERLSKLAANNKECQKGEQIFGASN